MRKREREKERKREREKERKREREKERKREREKNILKIGNIEKKMIIRGRQSYHEK